METKKIELCSTEVRDKRGFGHHLKSFYYFVYHEAMSCIFPVAIFFALAISKYIEIPGIYRYDFLLLVCLLMQFIMYKSGLETKDELKVISLFHLIGLALELFKVHMGSWSYPEEAYSKIYGVPLYSGFMYASVASYLCQAWRRLDLQLINWPKEYISFSLAFLIYLNFFTHHFVYDFRWILTGLLFVFFFKTWVGFTVNNTDYKLPMLLAFFLIGFFIWIAENISTFFGAWQYPNQSQGWQLVHLGKLSSWSLLVIISVILVANLKLVKQRLYK